jgi:malate dehydrogenase (oxaloacetate-decarboxylating)
MASPSPGYSWTFRVDAPADSQSVAALAAAVSGAGAELTAIDVAESRHDGIVIDVTCNCANTHHAEAVAKAIDLLRGCSVRVQSDRTFLLHLGGKLEVTPKVKLEHRDDLARAYTPGVARVCLAIAERPDDVRRLTIKRNTVAVVTDGSAVLGLGDIGPAAALPVMEGKAALFKHFARVDAWPVCLDTHDVDEIVEVVRAISPVYGGINLEDIAAPRCFEIERRLREILEIPVFHDDQHGTAIVVLAALTNALRLVGKDLHDIKVTVAGAGAAGYAIIRLLLRAGVRDLLAFDRFGAVRSGRQGLDQYLQWITANTNLAEFTGQLRDGIVGADVFIGVSAANILDGEDISRMADRAIVFALANPDPEVDPKKAALHAAVVGTGRSDYPNQINNVLAFPGLFRGLLDVGAREITSDMLLAAADAIASCVSAEELNANYVVPSVFDPKVAPAVARAVRTTASQATR